MGEENDDVTNTTKVTVEVATPKDPPEEKKTAGYLEDGDGNKSSGRLVKLLAFWTSAIIALSSLTFGIIGLFQGKLDGTSFVALAIGLVTSFLAVAVGSEIVQKTTGN